MYIFTVMAICILLLFALILVFYIYRHGYKKIKIPEGQPTYIFDYKLDKNQNPIKIAPIALLYTTNKGAIFIDDEGKTTEYRFEAQSYVPHLKDAVGIYKNDIYSITVSESLSTQEVHNSSIFFHDLEGKLVSRFQGFSVSRYQSKINKKNIENGSRII